MTKYSPINLLLWIMLLINPWISTAKLIPDKPNKTNCVLMLKKRTWTPIFCKVAVVTIGRQSIYMPKGNILGKNFNPFIQRFNR